jgi:PleD family two-component response regulator
MSEANQTRVVAVVDDMFFASKIRQAAESAGVSLEIVKNAGGLIDTLTSSLPELIVIDLNSKKLKPLELVRDLKSSEKLKIVPTLGYLPHVEEKLKEEAITAGCDIVMPRSRFSRELETILKKYGNS